MDSEGDSTPAALLHTWDQKLRTHIHLHCVVPGGALSFDKTEWLSLPREDYLFPVRALSRVFRGKFMEGLRGAPSRRVSSPSRPP
jgi:hypothetical protein